MSGWRVVNWCVQARLCGLLASSALSVLDWRIEMYYKAKSSGVNVMLNR